jgi:hypothetical protein
MEVYCSEEKLEFSALGTDTLSYRTVGLKAVISVQATFWGLWTRLGIEYGSKTEQARSKLSVFGFS